MKGRFLLLIISYFTFLFTSCNSQSGKRYRSDVNKDDFQNSIKNENIIYGKVVKIVDGDTYDLLINGSKTLRIRMEGIDAPEKGMPFYRVSKDYLGSLCFQKQVRLEKTSMDKRNNRIVGFTYLGDERELGHEMIKAGLAWHFKKYNSDLDLAELENEAREAKRGLWVDDNPMDPTRNRDLHKQGISTKDSFNLK